MLNIPALPISSVEALRAPVVAIKATGVNLSQHGKTLAYRGNTAYTKAKEQATQRFYLTIWNTIMTIVVDSEVEWEKDTFEQDFTTQEKEFLVSSLNITKGV